VTGELVRGALLERTVRHRSGCGEGDEAREEDRVIEMRRAQLAFGDGLIAEEVSDLCDHWMEAKSAHGTMASLERYVKKTDAQRAAASAKGRDPVGGTKSGGLSE
jgi:hypothetical protein